MLIDTVEPVLYVVEGSLVGHIESYYHSISLLVERVSYGAEPFLAGGVPNLHCNVLTLWRFVAGGDIVQTNGGHVRLSELLILVPIEIELVRKSDTKQQQQYPCCTKD